MTKALSAIAYAFSALVRLRTASWVQEDALSDKIDKGAACLHASCSQGRQARPGQGSIGRFIAAGDLACDDRRTQLTFSQVVGRGDFRSLQKREQMIPLLPQAQPDFLF